MTKKCWPNYKRSKSRSIGNFTIAKFRQRELRSQIGEADRRGDQEMLKQLIAEKLDIDRKLRDH